jgi:hypothetical protein
MAKASQGHESEGQKSEGQEREGGTRRLEECTKSKGMPPSEGTRAKGARLDWRGQE